MYTVYENVTTLSCYNSNTHEPILIICSINVTKKVKGTLFSHITSLVLLHYLGNRKPGNCVFSHKFCILFNQKHIKCILKILPVHC